MLKKMLSKWESRKLQVFAILLILSTCLSIWVFEGTVFSDWADFMKWLAGMYVVGNIGEHGAEAWKDGMAAKNGGQE